MTLALLMMLGPLAPVAAGEVCQVAVEGGGELVLELEQVADDDWAERCTELAAYVQLPAPPYTSQQAQAVTKLLVSPGYFAQAPCAVEGDVLLRCRLTPMPIVKSIEITGKVPFALLEQDVERRLFLRPGSLLDDETFQLKQQGARVRDYLVSEGYFGGRVIMRPIPATGAEPNRGSRIDAELHPGLPLTLRHIWQEGETRIPDHVLDDALRHASFLVFGTARFRPLEFDEDLEGVAAFLRERGWPEARVRGEYYIDRAAGAVDAAVWVQAGPRLVQRFSGHAALDADELEELTTFATAGVVDELELEASVLAITQAYQEEGYYAVSVTPDLSGDERERVAHFTIEEGPRAEVVRVDFAGGGGVPIAKLRDVELFTRASGWIFDGVWVDAWVTRDLETLRQLYVSQGFVDTELGAERQIIDPEHLRVTFTIREGRQRFVRTVQIEGAPVDLEPAALRWRLRLREGEPFVDTQLETDRQAIANALAAAGYTAAQVSQEVVGTETEQVSVTYRVVAGRRATFGGLFVRGGFRTSHGLLLRELDLDPGMALDLAAVGAARRRLRDLGIFTSVDVRPLPLAHAEAPTWLLVAVEEREVRALDAALSFATDELFSIGADYRDRNLFGRAVRLDLELRLANASELVWPRARIGNVDRAQVVVRAPRPFALPFDVEGSGVYSFADKPLYLERRVGGSGALVRTFRNADDCDLCPRFTVGLGYELISSRFESATLAPPSTSPNATVARLVPRASLDGRDSLVDPQSGYLTELRFELADELLAGPLNDAASFMRAIVAAQIYVPLGVVGRRRLAKGSVLGGPLVLAIATTQGALRPTRATPVPLSETFAYGGDTFVRGLAERASSLAAPGTGYLSTASLELRWYAWQDVGIGTFQLAVFTDVASVAYAASRLFESTTITAGPALRYVTPVGPISLSYGQPLWRARGIPPRGRLHFTFGYAF